MPVVFHPALTKKMFPIEKEIENSLSETTSFYHKDRLDNILVKFQRQIDKKKKFDFTLTSVLEKKIDFKKILFDKLKNIKEDLKPTCFDKHLDENFFYKKNLIIELKKIAFFLQNNSRSDIQAIILNQLLEGIEACTEGFYTRIINCVKYIEIPENLEALLEIIRRDIISEMMRFVTNSSVHNLNRLFNVAIELNFIQHNTDFDKYATRVDEELKVNTIKNLQKYYYPLAIVTRLFNKIKLLIESLGYNGEEDDGLKMNIVDRIIDALKIYFRGFFEEDYQSILEHFFIIQTDENFIDCKIIGMKWEVLQQQLLEYLFKENYISSRSLCLEEKILFSNARYKCFNREITLALIDLKISGFDSDSDSDSDSEYSSYCNIINYNLFINLINKINFNEFIIENDIKNKFYKAFERIINVHKKQFDKIDQSKTINKSKIKKIFLDLNSIIGVTEKINFSYQFKEFFESNIMNINYLKFFFSDAELLSSLLSFSINFNLNITDTIQQKFNVVYEWKILTSEDFDKLIKLINNLEIDKQNIFKPIIVPLSVKFYNLNSIKLINILKIFSEYDWLDNKLFQNIFNFDKISLNSLSLKNYIDIIQFFNRKDNFFNKDYRNQLIDKGKILKNSSSKNLIKILELFLNNKILDKDFFGQMEFDINTVEAYRVYIDLHLKRPDFFEKNALQEIAKNILEGKYLPNIVYLLKLFSENSEYFSLFKEMFFAEFFIQIPHTVLTTEMYINLLACIDEDAKFIEKVKPELVSYFKLLTINQENISELLAMFSKKPKLLSTLFESLCTINNKLIDKIKKIDNLATYLSLMKCIKVNSSSFPDYTNLVFTLANKLINSNLSEKHLIIQTLLDNYDIFNNKKYIYFKKLISRVNDSDSLALLIHEHDFFKSLQLNEDVKITAERMFTKTNDPREKCKILQLMMQEKQIFHDLLSNVFTDNNKTIINFKGIPSLYFFINLLKDNKEYFKKNIKNSFCLAIKNIFLTQNLDDQIQLLQLLKQHKDFMNELFYEIFIYKNKLISNLSCVKIYESFVKFLDGNDILNIQIVKLALIHSARELLKSCSDEDKIKLFKVLTENKNLFANIEEILITEGKLIFQIEDTFNFEFFINFIQKHTELSNSTLIQKNMLESTQFLLQKNEYTKEQIFKILTENKNLFVNFEEILITEGKLIFQIKDTFNFESFINFIQKHPELSNSRLIQKNMLESAQFLLQKKENNKKQIFKILTENKNIFANIEEILITQGKLIFKIEDTFNFESFINFIQKHTELSNSTLIQKNMLESAQFLLQKKENNKQQIFKILIKNKEFLENFFEKILILGEKLCLTISNLSIYYDFMGLIKINRNLLVNKVIKTQLIQTIQAFFSNLTIEDRLSLIDNLERNLDLYSPYLNSLFVIENKFLLNIDGIAIYRKFISFITKVNEFSEKMKMILFIEATKGFLNFLQGHDYKNEIMEYLSKFLNKYYIRDYDTYLHDMNPALYNDYFNENCVYQHDNDFSKIKLDRKIEVLEDYKGKCYLIAEDVIKKFNQFNGLLLTLLENHNRTFLTEKVLTEIFLNDPAVVKSVQVICQSADVNQQLFLNFIKKLSFLSPLVKEKIQGLTSITSKKTNIVQQGLFKTNNCEFNKTTNNEENCLGEQESFSLDCLFSK